MAPLKESRVSDSRSLKPVLNEAFSDEPSVSIPSTSALLDKVLPPISTRPGPDIWDLDSFDSGELLPGAMADPVSIPHAVPFNRNFRIEVCDQDLQTRGFSVFARSLINHCHKDSTRTQYQYGWSRWLDYTSLKGILDEEVTVATVCNFLAYHFKVKKKALNTIKNYFYSIRDPIKALYNLNIFDSSDIKKLFEGAFHERPPKRGQELMPKWLLSDLLHMLSLPPFEPLETADWDSVLIKTLCLIALATGRRFVEISAITDYCPTVNEDTIKFVWFKGFTAKMERESDGWTAVPPIISPLKSSDKTLCPVRCFRQYYALLHDMDREVFEGRMWPVGKTQLSYLVIGAIKDSFRLAHPHTPTGGVPNVGTHHLRKLACSYSWKYFNEDLAVFAGLVGSKNTTILFSTYIRDVPALKYPCVVPLGTVLPHAKVVHPLRTD